MLEQSKAERVRQLVSIGLTRTEAIELVNTLDTLVKEGTLVRAADGTYSVPTKH